MYCAECGRELSPDKKFCTLCGRPVSQQFPALSNQPQWYAHQSNELHGKPRSTIKRFERFVIWSFGIAVAGVVLFFAFALFMGNRMVEQQKEREENYPVQPENSQEACSDFFSIPVKSEYSELAEILDLDSSYNGTTHINYTTHYYYEYKAKIKNKTEQPIIVAMNIKYTGEGAIPLDSRYKMCLSNIYIPANETRKVKGRTIVIKKPDYYKAWIIAIPYSEYKR